MTTLATLSDQSDMQLWPAITWAALALALIAYAFIRAAAYKDAGRNLDAFLTAEITWQTESAIDNRQRGINCCAQRSEATANRLTDARALSCDS